MSQVNTSFIISLTIILIGYISKRTGILKESDGEAISRIVFNITLPATIITVFSNVKVDPALFSIPVVSYFYCLAMTIFALYVFRNKTAKEKGMLTILVPAFNIGLFAYPMIGSIWGDEGMKYFGMFDIGNSFIIFGSNYIIASKYSGEVSNVDYRSILKKVVSSIPLLAYAVTLVFKIAGLNFPAFLLNIAGTVSKGNTPLSLLLLGLYLSFNFNAGNLANMAKVLAMRYVPGLLIGILIYRFLPVNILYRTTLMVGMILPISLATIPYSVQFKYDSKFVGTLNNITIITSFILMWIMVSIIT